MAVSTSVGAAGAITGILRPRGDGPAGVRIVVVDLGGANNLVVTVQGSHDELRWFDLARSGPLGVLQAFSFSTAQPPQGMRAVLEPDAAVDWTAEIMCDIHLSPAFVDEGKVTAGEGLEEDQVESEGIAFVRAFLLAQRVTQEVPRRGPAALLRPARASRAM